MGLLILGVDLPRAGFWIFTVWLFWSYFLPARGWNLVVFELWFGGEFWWFW